MDEQEGLNGTDSPAMVELLKDSSEGSQRKSNSGDLATVRERKLDQRQPAKGKRGFLMMEPVTEVAPSWGLLLLGAFCLAVVLVVGGGALVFFLSRKGRRPPTVASPRKPG